MTFINQIHGERKSRKIANPLSIFKTKIDINSKSRLLSLLGVYGLTFLANRRRLKKVNLQEQFIMAYGGLRGAVGFSLVSMVNAEVIPPAQMFVTTTLAVVMFTIFFQVRQKCLQIWLNCFVVE